MPVFILTSCTSWRCSFPFPPASTFSPSTSIVPNEGSSRKLIQRNKVLLPEPLRPIRHTTSRGATSIETSLRTCRRPKYLSSLVTRTIGAILTVSFGKAGFDDALNIREDQRHYPIKERRHDKGLQVM